LPAAKDFFNSLLGVERCWVLVVPGCWVEVIDSEERSGVFGEKIGASKVW
jgi:hypothetical protein